MIRKSSRYMRFFSTGLSTAGLLFAVPAMSQTKNAQSNTLEEIVVTARKSSEKMQITPVAVTALTPKSLESRQVSQISDLVRAAPNLSALGSGTATALVLNFAIRGQAQSNGASSNDSPVAVYVDGVYRARMQGGSSMVLDMAGAEVLRGPQGTLFGRNTTGGAINLTTHAPTNKFEGYLKVGLGNYDQREVESVINVPLSQDFATRFVVRYDERSGYFKNANTGTRQGDIAGNYYVRTSAQWAPSDKPLTLRITGDYTHYRDNGTPSVLRGLDTSNATLRFLANGQGVTNLSQYLSTDSNFFSTYAGVNAFGLTGPTGLPLGSVGFTKTDILMNRILAKGVNANLDVDLGEVHLKSITAYRDSTASNSYDLDSTPAALFAFWSQYVNKQFSQELNLSGSIAKFDWQTGVYYFRESGSDESDSYNPAFPIARTVGRDLTDFRSTSTGVFVQTNYHVTDRLRLTGGFRYTWDTRSANRYGTLNVPIVNGGADFQGSGYCAVGPYPGGPAGATTAASGYLPALGGIGGCNEYRTGSFQYPAWIASVDYQWNDEIFTYLKTSGASLAGGVNFRLVPPTAVSFEPEHVKDVEAGIKADLLDRKLRTNLAAFYSWRNGLQVNVNVPISGRTTQYQVNAGKAKIYGVEFETTVLPWDGMQLDGNIAYLHAKYNQGSFLVANYAGVPNALDRSGEWVQQAPQWTWSLGATQGFNMPWGRISAHLDYSYTATFAQYQTTYDPTQPGSTVANAIQANNFGLVPGRGLLNGRLAFNIDSPDLEIAFWGRNLTNKHYYSSAFTGAYVSLGFTSGAIGDPRAYGATITYHW